MFKKSRKIAAAVFALAAFLAGQAAAWAETAGISTKTANEVGQKVVEVVRDITMPLGAAVIFVSVVIVAFKLIASAGKPDDRGKVIGSIPYIIGGGIALGGAILIAGWIIGMMVKAAS
ncbi:MAG: hypothetical protein HPY89_00660 [Pelotomaculum sp.]|uniref:Hypothetical membrane protein n=1 Tax=Pelotomaculum thermopropionicum (strain DSM 13744 / JCM 10971 / SI) TaxID=370438 RepID=A5CZ98_PELTS|nr:hypothetical protein [Pelotomaculum sp.]BAF60667.1 hypothetical membrane protein [Pelotomaculum thermopropionicum SI]